MTRREVDGMFLLFPSSDVKKLAEKEDWVVDNEGLTSLVRSLYPITQHNENQRVH